MSEQNKALVRRFYDDVMTKKSLKVIDEILAPGFVDRRPEPGQAPGVQGIKDQFNMFIKAFPDMSARIEEQAAEKDTVVAHVTITGTHKGDLMGAKPTGKKVTVHALDLWHAKNGKLTEVWHYGDEGIAFAQLGVKPPM